MASSRNLDRTRGVLTSVDLRRKMDALVSDLTHALDESQLPQYHKKRRGFKRRNRVINSLGLAVNRLGSDDSSSSLGDILLSQDNKSSMPLSDSDDLSPTPQPRMCDSIHLVHHRTPPSLVESDSLNENFPPTRPNNRRKQKGKRMALDPDAPSMTVTTHTSTDRLGMPSSVMIRKKKSLRPSETESRYVDISAGKRKRGRDRSTEWGETSRHRPSSGHFHNIRLHNSHSSQGSTEYTMDCQYSDESNISDSSSENEAGNYTCDEGREADDEQSDWFAESGPVYGVPGASDSASEGIYNSKLAWWNHEEFGLSPTAKALFKERYETMSQENQQACRLRFQKLRERLLRREIRAGRRRLQDRRPGFSIVSSVNDKVSRFLQDPMQSELRLKPMTENDRNQLTHLANLYSLNVRAEDDKTAPILTKTRNTITTRQLDTDPESTLACSSSFPGGLPVPLSDLKRRRKTPPPPPQNLTEGSNDSIESVILSPSGSGGCSRPPVPLVSWGEDDMGDCCADSLSERLADSEPDPLPSPSSLGLNDCTL